MIRVVLNFTILILMAALISPNEMAVYAAILTGFALFAPFLDAGLANVYLKYDRPQLQPALFTINTAIGISFSALFFIAHPVLEQVFNLTINRLATLLFCIAILFQSLTIQYKSQLLKEKNFLVIGVIETIASTIAFLIVLASSYFHVSVALLLLRHAIEDISLFFLFKSRSKTKLRISAADALALPKDIVSYSTGIIQSRVLTSFARDADRFFYGITMSSAFFGAIHYFRQITLMFDQILRVAVTTVAFSYSAKMTDATSNDFFEDVYILMFALVSLPIFTFLQFGPSLGTFFVNEKWSEYLNLLVPLSIFCLALVKRGWIGTKYIDRQMLKKLNKLFCLEIILYVFVLLTCFTYDLQGFDLVTAHAFSALIFWSVVVLLDWKTSKQTGSGPTIPILLVLSCVMAIVGIIFSNTVSHYLAPLSFFEQLSLATFHFVLLCSFLGMLCMLRLVKRPAFLTTFKQHK